MRLCGLGWFGVCSAGVPACIFESQQKKNAGGDACATKITNPFLDEVIHFSVKLSNY